jgi:hypothetical protein
MTLIVPLKVFALLQMQLFIQEAYITIDFRLISYFFFLNFVFTVVIIISVYHNNTIPLFHQL